MDGLGDLDGILWLSCLQRLLQVWNEADSDNSLL